MSSGIGPAEHLRATGIAPIVDLPVGENLIDHLPIGVVYNSRVPISLMHTMVTERCAFGRHRRGGELRAADRRRRASLHAHPRFFPGAGDLIA